ncbi:MAG: hypothetical protein ABFS56_04805 [Pseudomonadota bacterium]
MELLSHSRILAALPTDSLGSFSLEILDVVDSTNRYALEHTGAEPFACLAEYQTAGRGQPKWALNGLMISGGEATN